MTCEVCEVEFPEHPGCSYWEWQERPGKPRYVRRCRSCYTVKKPFRVAV